MVGFDCSCSIEGGCSIIKINLVVRLLSLYQVDRDAAERGKNEPRGRWRRATFLVNRLGDGTPARALPGKEVPDAERKVLETQHWLELIDGYDSLLRYFAPNIAYLFRKLVGNIDTDPIVICESN